MKKKDCDYYRKREVWFIRPPLESNHERDDENVWPQGYEDELIALFDEPSETTGSITNNEEEFTEREVDHVS